MRIGIDFDNTIVNYESTFYYAALDRGLIPGDIKKSKNDIRDYLNNNGQKDAFTELQGYVYGARMDLAKPFDGVLNFIRKAKAKNYKMNIVSHKSVYPLRGPKFNLHEAATKFLFDSGFINENLLAIDDVYFEETKEQKIQRIKNLDLDVFIDDLPEILDLLEFINIKKRVLFDPGKIYLINPRFIKMDSWIEIARFLGV